MKQGSEYAKRIRRLLTQLLRKSGKPETTDGVDPTEQLIIGILAGCSTHAKALAVYRKLRQNVVDLNELRVTPAVELAEQIGDGVPLARAKAQRIVDALNAVRKRQDSLDLSFLRSRGRREAREYLESLEGVDRAAAASVVLFSLGGHAIPVDGLMLHVLRKEEYVDATADVVEVQGFLERSVAASQAQIFYELVSRYAAGRPLKVPYERLDELVRPAPAPPATAPPPGLPLPAAPPKAAPPASAVRSATTGKPAAPRAAAPARAAAETAPDKSAAKKTQPREARVSEPADPAGSDHNRGPAKAAALRKKK